MKWFKRAFIVALIAFLGMYLIAILKGAPNFYKEIFRSKDELAENPLKTEPDKPKETPKKEEPEEEPEELEGKFFFLIMGMDGKDVFSETVRRNTRTDTMILTSLDFDTGEVVLMNMPRDTKIDWNGRTRKLNSVFGASGPEGTMDAINEITGLGVKQYALVDYEAVKDLVDSLGGVDFEVPWNMRWVDPTADPPLDINLKEGMQTLDGDKAIQLLRWRKNLPGMGNGGADGSDIHRIKNQQAFIKEVLRTALQRKNLVKLPQIATSVLKHVDTNIERSTIVKAAFGARKLNIDEMTMLTLPGEGKYIGKESFYVHYVTQTKTTVEAYFSNYLLKQ